MSTSSFDADSTLGALLIGTLVSFALFGVTTTQVYIYYRRFPQDSFAMKALVASVWCGESAHAICVAAALYKMLITNYGHPERLLVLPNSFLASTFFGSLVTFGVQTFFAYRIYALSKNLWLPYVWLIPCLCWALSLFRFIPPNIILFAYGHQPAPQFLGRFGPLFDAIWAASAANDLLIAGTLVVLLYGRRNAGLQLTVAMVDKLIAWTIETGVVTSIASIIMLVVFITLPSTFVWLAIFVTIPRLFANSLLASLNSRAALRHDNSHEFEFSIPKSPARLIGRNTSQTNQSHAVEHDRPDEHHEQPR
ncbi:hypothetical protein DFH08DRAFT_1073310 [Mycena albidolilacea]|uniref:DUF6534 domain-containing protein n=1 Tax=Mycena albidolilacea TaxID=1033008 RepID=A0AAD7F2I2_9AGAR|nr:hypothetical protein DFH08DRAFT_1073310 [Mycena albidolilacea]